MRLIYKVLSIFAFIFLLNSTVNAAQKYCTKEDVQSKFIIHIYGESYQNVDDKRLFLRGLDMQIILIERTPYQELEIYFDLKDFVKKTIMKFLISVTYQSADLCISNSRFILVF